MFKYEIYYRIDSSEFMETDSIEIEASSIEEIFDEIRSIERRNTVLYVKNLDALE